MSRDSLLTEKVLSSGKKGLNFPSEHADYMAINGSVIKPNDPPTRPEGSTLTKEEVSSIEKYTKDTNQYSQEQAVVFQQIASTIPDSLYLKIKGKATVKEAWDTLKANFEKRLQMITIELCK